MGDTAFFLLPIVDLTLGFFVWLYLKDYFNRFKWWKAALIKSLTYALFFGIGAIGEGGGEPGFMLPFPVAPAAIVALTESKFYVFIQNALIPYGFWIMVFFAIFCLKHIFKKLGRGKPSIVKQ
jgi:hypothetical protein